MAISPAKGKLVRIVKASSEYKGKIGKLLEETTDGAWWVSLDKGHVLEVMLLADFVVLSGPVQKRKKKDPDDFNIGAYIDQAGT